MTVILFIKCYESESLIHYYAQGIFTFNCVFIYWAWMISYAEIICLCKREYFTEFLLSKLLKLLYLCCSGHDHEKQALKIVELIEYWFDRAFAFLFDILF